MQSSFSWRVLCKLTKYLLCVCLGVGVTGIARADVKTELSDRPGSIAWHVADQKDFFSKHGATVKLVRFASYTDSLVAAGPTIPSFLSNNELTEGRVNYAKGIDFSLSSLFY